MWEGITVQFSSLTHFMPLVSFYTPWKHQKTIGFLMFSAGLERDSSMKWVKRSSYKKQFSWGNEEEEPYKVKFKFYKKSCNMQLLVQLKPMSNRLLGNNFNWLSKFNLKNLSMGSVSQWGSVCGGELMSENNRIIYNNKLVVLRKPSGSENEEIFLD